MCIGIGIEAVCRGKDKLPAHVPDPVLCCLHMIYGCICMRMCIRTCRYVYAFVYVYDICYVSAYV